MAISIIPISKMHYEAFYRLAQRTRWGNLMLPVTYRSSLWGMVVLKIDKQSNVSNNMRGEVIGGWVGTLRGNGRLMHLVAKSVYFDAYPCFVSAEIEKQYLPQFLDTVKQYARTEGIIMLRLTHWVRGKQLSMDESTREATFLIPLHSTYDNLWKMVDSKQRNCVRKGEKSGVVVEIFHGENSMRYLSDFQHLRKVTQQHAMHNHAQASMLLKSDAFFADKFLDPKATLFVGSLEKQIVAVALMIQAGGTVYYYSGGSDYELNRKCCCSSYVLWKAICYYNHNGADYFDMGGVPVSPESTHPAYGVYMFKRSFGGIYDEFEGGTIVINQTKYKTLKFLLSQRKILRFFSSKM